METNEIKSLTVDQAKELIERNRNSYWLDLNGLLELSPDVAKCLAKYRGSLELNGLVELSSEAAVALANCDGPELLLDGVSQLSVDAAKALATFEGHLSLDGLTELGPEVLRALVAKSGRKIQLFGPNSKRGFKVTGPEAMVAYDRKLVRQESIEHVTLGLAEVLAKHDTPLYLPGVSDLTVDAAKILATHTGGYLHLPGMRTLSMQVAEALAGYKDYLILDGLTTLRLDVAEALANQQCSTLLEYTVDFDDEQEVDDFLRRYGVYEDSVVFLTQEPEEGQNPCPSGSSVFSEDAVCVCAKYGGELNLRGLTNVPLDVAKALAKHEGNLYLGSLDVVAAETAAVLRSNNRISFH
jgi:hypothetical protein